MHYHKELQKKYDHALDRIYDLFKIGREREKELETKIELARDELIRISNICASETGGHEKSVYFEEIKQLCDRGLDSTHV